MLRASNTIPAIVGVALLAVANLGMSCGAPVSRVSIDSPADGVMLDQASVLVTGSTTTIGPDMELKVNGVVVPLVTSSPGAVWSTTVTLDPGAVLNPIEAVLRNTSQGFLIDQTRIMVIAGQSIADGSFSPQALGLRINDGALNDLESFLPSLVNLDIATLLPGGTLVIDDFCYLDGGFVGCLGSVDVRISGSPAPSLGGFSIDMDSNNNFVEGDITLSNLFIRADVDDDVGVPLNCTIDITATSAFIPGDYNLGPDLPSASAPSVEVDAAGLVSVVFTGFNDSTSCGGLLGGLVELLIDLFIGDVQDLVQPAIAAFLNAGFPNTPIANAIETALDGIEISGPIGDTLGVQLETPVRDVPEDNAGLTVDTDFKITTQNGAGPGQCLIPPGAPDLTASYHVAEAFPPFGATTPISGLPYDVALCVSSSAFNQLLKGLTECGALNAVVTELSGTPITASLLALAIDAFQILPPNTPLEVRIEPVLAPLVTGNPGPGGEIAELLIGQLKADVVQDLGGPIITHLSMAIDVTLGFDLTFDGVGLVPTVSPVDPGDIEVFILDNRINAAQNEVKNQVPPLVAPLIPALTSILGAIPIPELLGLDLSSVAIEKNGQFISVFLDASVAP